MTSQFNWGDLGQPLEKLDYVPRDPSWQNLLPEGSLLLSATGYGGSYWSKTGKIDVRLANDATVSYFIKLSRDEIGRQMVEGEFESMKLLKNISHDMVPKPVGYGTYETDENTHFFLCEFVDLYDELPDVVDFCQGVAEMHRRSMKHSPSSEFGFQITTCNETIRQHTKWSQSWEVFFTQALLKAFDDEEEVHGPSFEIQELKPNLIEKVCPRLLRPLETEGRTLRPCLVHGDLWDGNIGVRAKTGQAVIFDASALWAHNEYELHIWRGARYRIGKTFRKEYSNHFPISPPEEDWEDRNLLYSLMADLHSSALFKHTTKFRGLLINSMRELVDKFPYGYEGSARAKGSAEVNGGATLYT